MMVSSPLSSEKINIAVVGLGWWGPKLLRNFMAHDCIASVVGCDLDSNRRRSVAKEYHVPTIENVLEIINDSSINAMAIATPPSTHYEIARLALNQGKHVLLTKPPTSTLIELEDLVKTSEREGATLMLDSAFVYAPMAKRMKSMLEDLPFSQPTSLYSFRHGDDLHFHDIERLKNTMLKNGIDVVEDLLFHDLSLLTYLFREKLDLKSIRRFYNIDHHLCDTAIVELHTNHFPLHISLSWTLPERKRQFLIFAKGKYLLLDDLRETGKLRLFEFETKTETDIFCEKEEPLFCEVDHFVNCIINGKKPLTDGPFMLQVMEIYDQVRRAKE